MAFIKCLCNLKDKTPITLQSPAIRSVAVCFIFETSGQALPLPVKIKYLVIVIRRKFFFITHLFKMRHTWFLNLRNSN